ncbi:amidohydrolase [Microbacterium sp.]|uniref:amidohydrolase n=1 Tax=Microbacterium sp. TaxID=51671 RepID=UPI003A92D2E3
MSATTDIAARYDTIRAEQEAFYQDLHAHPELSHRETRTAGRVADLLAEDGFAVTTGIGGTGVVGVLHRGDGPVVLVRADMDALPVREDTGAAYASTVEVDDGSGVAVPVMHACGHDAHVSCLVGAARLLAEAGDGAWSGTLVALFQPAEETGDGARGMVDDGLLAKIPAPDVALAQHVLPFAAGRVATRPGAVLSSADSLRITVHGRGGHGSMPQNTVDPVVIAAQLVVSLQTIVSREVAPTDPAVVTVGSLRAGSKSNIIPDSAVIELNIRDYNTATRQRILDAIRRIADGVCTAGGCPQPPDIELFDSFPPTVNDPAVTARVAQAFGEVFGEDAGTLDLQTASEDFSDIPVAAGVPYTYWGIGGVDPATWQAAVEAGRVLDDIPVNHSPRFLPVMQPTLRVGTTAVVAAALAWLAAPVA